VIGSPFVRLWHIENLSALQHHGLEKRDIAFAKRSIDALEMRYKDVGRQIEPDRWIIL
jgi:hypothetical protein